MRRSVFYIVVIFFFSCTLKTKDGHQTDVQDVVFSKYYDSGEIKEKQIHKSSGKVITYFYHKDGYMTDYIEMSEDGEYDGVCRSFYSNGNIKAEGCFSKGKADGKMIDFDSNGDTLKSLTFKNGIRQGIARIYDGGSLIQKTLEVEGEELIHVKYDRSYSDTSIIVTSFVRRENDEFLPEGQMVTDLKGNVLIDSLTYYYTIEKENDTVKLGQNLNVKLKLHNKEQAKIALRIGEIESNFKFIEKPIEFYSENKELFFEVSAEKKGWNLIVGEMIVAKKIDENKNITGTRFYVFDDYYVTD